jgi:MFS family permease
VGGAPGRGEEPGPRGIAVYRAVLALPGVGALTAVAFAARIPSSAAAITLTLHVVLTLDRGYAAAGLVAAAVTVGGAISAPLLGRLVDRRGLRSMLTITVCSAAVFWSAAPSLSYPPLLAAAVLAGLLATPSYSVSRQSLVVLVPPGSRRAAFALDSMSVEVSYVMGPALGTLLALQLSTGAAMWAVGTGAVLSGVAFFVLDPPTRAPASGEPGPAPRVREWFDLRLLGALLATVAAVGVIFGSELSVIAGLQLSGQAGWIPVVNAVWCLGSLTGGFLYGSAGRSWSLPVLVAGLGVATLPVALAGSWWSYALLLVPAGLLCAPSLAASAEVVTAHTPEHARGLVTGMHGSAITLGAAGATPIAGLLIDLASPATAVLVVAVTGIAGAGLAGLATSGGSPPRR